MDEKALSASWQALVRLGRVYVAGAIAFLLTGVADIINVVEWDKMGDSGTMWRSIATLLLTGLLTFLGKVVREPTVPVSVAEAAASLPEGSSIRQITRDTSSAEKIPF